MTKPRPGQIDETALVDPSCSIGAGTRIWGLAQVRENAVIGAECVIGRGAYIGSGVSIGARCKIQNAALVYEPARLGDGVFVGPGAVLANDNRPRAVNPDGSPKRAADWPQVGVVVEEGASIGANAVCVAPVLIGAWALVAAGSIVTLDVPAFSLVAGVPARHVAWVGRTASRLVETADGWSCPDTDERFVERGGLVVPITPPTPAESSVGGDLNH